MALTVYPRARSSGTSLPPTYPEAPVTKTVPMSASGLVGRSEQKRPFGLPPCGCCGRWIKRFRLFRFSWISSLFKVAGSAFSHPACDGYVLREAIVLMPYNRRPIPLPQPYGNRGISIRQSPLDLVASEFSQGITRDPSGRFRVDSLKICGYLDSFRVHGPVSLTNLP